ncbi:MAG: DUF3526 domain-containing protein [Cyclobacteriaceae bacterium]|nr:DUF3526 domain-containing protein [Cyclobacteriaceae bacterium]
MFFHYVKYEGLQLIRNRWAVVLLIVFVVLCLFAVSNGTGKVTLRKAETETAVNTMREADEVHKAKIDSLEKGLLSLEDDGWRRRLNYIGNRAPRVAVMPPASLAFLATGQSDLYPHTMKAYLYVNIETYAASFTELSNPVQLMFGSFDLAFVLIYLLPLLVLAFSYNLLSEEKEQGLLRLTLAQPVSLYGWLFNKMLLRFFLMTAIVWGSLIVALLVAGVSWSFGILPLLGLVTLYIFFWFAVALIVNVFGKTSGTNAVAVISVWTVLVLLLPAVISQLANNLYPVPSRVNMIHEMRTAKAEAEKEANKILASYYRDHPELAQQDTTVKNQYQFYLGYFASQDVVKKSVAPVLEEYREKSEAQKQFVESFRFVSPALLLQHALNDIAGTSSRHYEAYKNRVIAFTEEWRAWFLPRMFNNELMSSSDFEKLPSFEYNYDEVASSFAADFVALLVFAVLLTGISVWVYRKEGLEPVLTS